MGRLAYEQIRINHNNDGYELNEHDIHTSKEYDAIMNLETSEKLTDVPNLSGMWCECREVQIIDDLQLWISEREGKIPIEVLYLPRPSSDYKGSYPMWFEKHLSRLLETKDYVYFFGGKSITGYRIDLKPELNPELVANVENLSMIKSNSFTGGMADPPYDERFAKEKYNLPYPNWSKWTKELVRIVKPNGLIGIMQNYPVPRLAGCEWEKIVIILLRIKQFCKVVTIQRKNALSTLRGNGN